MYAPLPPQYAYLLGRDDLPSILRQMLRLHGLKERPGSAADNPEILALADEVGLGAVYRHDETPWCGLGMAAAVHRAGYALPDSPLWALSWAKWGEATPTAMLGDVVVFRRPGGGHVGLYVGEDDEAYHILGCNQQDECDIRRFGRSFWTRGASFGVTAIRRSPWRIAQPQSVRVVRLGPDGPIGDKVT